MTKLATNTDIEPLADAPCSALPPVLDACCGGRMMWFDKKNPLALYMDKRRETVKWEKRDNRPGRNVLEGVLEVNPDVLGDFTEMPFPDESFHLVAFDPPHFDTLNDNARTAKLYGRLLPDWECEIAAGFAECFRVLKPFGTLIFKWNSTCIPVEKVIELAETTPLFGHKCGRQSKTHWLAFLKQNV